MKDKQFRFTFALANAAMAGYGVWGVIACPFFWMRVGFAIAALTALSFVYRALKG